jgi:hypothetical protein
MRTLKEIRQKNKRNDLLIDGMESDTKKFGIFHIIKRIRYYIERKKLKKFINHNREKIDKIANTYKRIYELENRNSGIEEFPKLFDESED